MNDARYSTHSLELPVPYSVYTEISEESDIQRGAQRLGANSEEAVRDERSDDYRSSNAVRSCAYVGINPAETECVRVYGISEGKEYADAV